MDTDTMCLLGIGAQSTLGGGHNILPENICMKNWRNARILHDICLKNYQNAQIFIIFVWNTNKIPEFYMIITRKNFPRILGAYVPKSTT